jgi:DNA-binding NarL/FixJ family response regulator
MSRPRVLIADDHEFVAEACRALLEREYDVVGIVGDGRTLVDVASGLQPQVIVIDIGMPLLNGLDAGQSIKETLKSVKLVYLTMNSDPELAAEAFRRGASAYLIKTCDASELIVAVREVLKGMTYLSCSVCRDEVDFLLRKGEHFIDEHDRLTSRQREVLQLVAEGMSMKDIANLLQITTNTVAFHKYRIMEVLKAKSNADLVHYAVRNNIAITARPAA